MLSKAEIKRLKAQGRIIEGGGSLGQVELKLDQPGPNLEADPFIISDEKPGVVEILLPECDTRSEANSTENWRTKHARHRKQKAIAAIAMHNLPNKIPLPCQVRFVRLAPRAIDSDNNVSAFKYFRDTVAAELTGDFRPGRADNDPRISWDYGQEKAKQKGVMIIFKF